MNSKWQVDVESVIAIGFVGNYVPIKQIKHFNNIAYDAGRAGPTSCDHNCQHDNTCLVLS